MTNAERQAAYRARQRQAREGQRNAPVTVPVPPIGKEGPPVTARDWIDKEGNTHIYLGNWGMGPQYALVVNHVAGDGSPATTTEAGDQ